MSKVYDALQRGRAERNLIGSRIESGAVVRTRKPEIIDISELPPIKMEKEMGRLLRNIAGLLPDSQRGVIQFVGSRKKEGTSTILREFGIFLSIHMNKAVLLIEGEGSQTPHHQAFGVYPKKSIKRIMEDGGSIDDAVCQVKSSHIFLSRLFEDAPANSRPDYSVNHAEIWSKLGNAFDFVLIDSPSLTSSDNTLEQCAFVDGVLLVVEAEKTRSQVVHNLKERVVQAGGNVLGVVFNKQRYYIPKLIYKLL
jgi:Mrp family chromosome partitioning ATPase